ncbi:MAG: archaeosortase/exosortase family protein [Blastocatellia bacterium]
MAGVLKMQYVERERPVAHEGRQLWSHRSLKLSVLIAAQVAAFWPVWRWYIQRATDGSDDPWGLAAVAIALHFIFREKSASEVMQRPLWLPALLVIGYAAGYHLLSPLPRAVVAVTCLAATISRIRFGKRLHLGILGLLMLSLPMVASLQFFLGYPLRSFAAMLAAPMLRMNGIAVTRQGTALNWAGRLIEIDAPCSGVKMLWAGMFLTFILVCFFRLNTKRTLLVVAFALAAIVLGNVLRSTALFYVEAGLVILPPIAHTGIGLVVFALSAMAIVWTAMQLGKPELLAAPRRGSVAFFSPTFSCLFFFCCLAAAIAPVVSPQTNASNVTEAFPGWPAQLDGRDLKPLPLSAREERFAADFPGRIARFTDGTCEIIVRWVGRETRTLHPASDCLKALGYAIKPLPLRVDEAGHFWSQFEATRDADALRVSERIYSTGGDQSWTDVSSWYWESLLGKTEGPWWAVTVAERREPQP